MIVLSLLCWPLLNAHCFQECRFAPLIPFVFLFLLSVAIELTVFLGAFGSQYPIFVLRSLVIGWALIRSKASPIS